MAAPAPAALPAPASPTPVTAAGGLPGSAPPGGVPVDAPGRAVDRAAANGVAPARAVPPKFVAPPADEDFGDVGSGQRVRRTIRFETTGAGEVEFSLYVPNAPGLEIAALRVMGQGATISRAPATYAPRSRGAAPTSAPRSVATQVTAPPWAVKYAGPAEVQADIDYAPHSSRS